MNGREKIVVFTGNFSFSVRKCIVEIDNAIPDLSWLILVHQPKKTIRQLLKNQRLNFRRNGWRWISYQAADIWNRFARQQATNLLLPYPGSNYSITALESNPNIRIVGVNDLHGQESLEIAKAFEPYLGLSLAAPILRRPLFSIPKLGTINLHKGKVPDYRGMPPAFWEFWNDEKSVGCTVHWVDDRLDTGDIVCEKNVKRAEFSTVHGMQLQLDEVGNKLMREAVKKILFEAPTYHPQKQGGKTYRKPTLAQIATLERRLGSRKSPGFSISKEILKDSRSILSQTCWHLGLGKLLRPRITVLLYHRVSDEVRDNLTVGIDQFDRQMALLRKHCTLLTIQQVLESGVIPKSNTPLVAVTFDDGYLDNYENAAPILMRHGIPAAFFVSTGIVNTHGQFPHDLRRGNPPIPLMTWNQLKDMQKWGFTIGSHTVNHIDCAAESEETVREELAQSREDLRRELNLSEFIFAYPYGGRAHMTQQRLELVKEAGYSGCLSAYGGRNIDTVDRYNVLRRGIHWEFSDRAFLFECLGIL